MAADAVSVLDGHGIGAAHVAGASLDGAIAQWLAVHRPRRVLSLTAIMTGPMGHNAGPAWARALAGKDPDPGDLPPPAPQFLRHLAEQAARPQTTRDQRVTAAVETWRVLHGDAPPTRCARWRTAGPWPRRSRRPSWKRSPAWATDSSPPACPATSASPSSATRNRRQAPDKRARRLAG